MKRVLLLGVLSLLVGIGSAVKCYYYQPGNPETKTVVSKECDSKSQNKCMLVISGSAKTYDCYNPMIGSFGKDCSNVTARFCVCEGDNCNACIKGHKLKQCSASVRNQSAVYTVLFFASFLGYLFKY